MQKPVTSLFRGFWDTLSYPVIALSPMDGVTDAAFRYIADKYGKPGILFTEFTAVEAISRGKTKVLEAFIYHKTDTPTVAQIFGTEVESYYITALVVAAMGFDGIDINMGCPAKSVSEKGAGAGLILQPKLAQEIVRTTKRAAKDWSEGITLEQAGVHEDVISFVKKFENNVLDKERSLLPVSVKTRIGYDKPVVEEWIPTLLEVEPVNISLHGRTLKQMYTGLADWEQIGKAAEIIKKTAITIMGNGDVHSLEDAYERISNYNLDGVLIGRATFGNPWVFQGKEADMQTKLKTALEHTKQFVQMTPEQNFLSLRKHLAWYCKGFPNATELRVSLVRVNNEAEVEQVIQKYLQ